MFRDHLTFGTLRTFVFKKSQRRKLLQSVWYVYFFSLRSCIEFRKYVRWIFQMMVMIGVRTTYSRGTAPARLDPEMPGGSVRKYSTAGQYRERWRESMRRESRRVLSFRASSTHSHHSSFIAKLFQRLIIS